MGDSNEELVADVMMEGSQRPIEGYIAAVAAGGKDSATLTSSSVLYMLSHHTGFYDIMQQDSEQVKPYQKVKLTHLTLVDGDNNQIHARMATHLADTGIQLELFSEFTYHMNDYSSPMPALFVIRCTRVGHAPVAVQKDLHEMIHYAPSPSKHQSQSTPQSKGQSKSSYPILDPLTQPLPECTYENRLCRKFGVNFISCCICNDITVKG